VPEGGEVSWVETGLGAGEKVWAVTCGRVLA
jgi:hypothetical protein